MNIYTNSVSKFKSIMFQFTEKYAILRIMAAGILFSKFGKW